jgi:transporter family-2 protein
MGENILLIALALCAGVSLGINRALIGKVGQELGAINASIINHLSGALFLAVIILFQWDFSFIEPIADIPSYALLGGAIGAFFVIITSYVIPKIGVLKTSVLFIGGQLLSGSVIDYFLGKIENPLVSIIGLSLIFTGVLIGFFNKEHSQLEN